MNETGEMKKSITYRGQVVWVGEAVTKAGKNGHAFTSRQVVISPDADAERPTMLLLTLRRGQKEDRTKLIDERHKGAICTVEFFPDVRFWDDPKTGKRRAFGDNVVWKVTFEDMAKVAEAEPKASDDFIDDMPF